MVFFWFNLIDFQTCPIFSFKHKFRRNMKKVQRIGKIAIRKKNLLVCWCYVGESLQFDTPITHTFRVAFDLAQCVQPFNEPTSHVILVHFISSGHAKYCNKSATQRKGTGYVFLSSLLFV